MLFVDVTTIHRGPARSDADIVAVRDQGPPTTLALRFCRWVAVNMTPLVWPAYLVFLDGVLTHQTGTSPARRRPHHFVTLCLCSVVIWSLFDVINFYFIHAWDYLGMPGQFWRDRFWGYVLAFGAIMPAMLWTGQAIGNAAHLQRLRGPALRLPRALMVMLVLIGAATFVWPMIRRDPVTNYTLWLSLILLLDPQNLALGRPSLFGDWSHGRYGRTIALGAGGLACGLLWEFWNYWALAKWTYRLPFLGALEHVRYFEMPLPGLLGFIPFGPQCWVMWQTMRIPLDGMVEPLPDENALA